ncbi:hypothetical protein [Burkholderia ubonensis]|nr:hypothetical protein [Burkholderia ubonensis]
MAAITNSSLQCMIAVATAARRGAGQTDVPMLRAQPYVISILLRGEFGMR